MNPNSSEHTHPVYVGSSRPDAGIYLLRFNPRDGSLTTPELLVKVAAPSFLALHPNRQRLYAVSETHNEVIAFAIDPASGMLAEMNRAASGGAGPCHLCIDAGGRNVLVANYGDGSAVVLPTVEDGSLRPASCVVRHSGHGVDPRRQRGPHAHQICLDVSESFAFVPDLGLDKVMIYRFDPAGGMLTAIGAAQTPAGMGPRHLAFHPSRGFACLFCEMSSTLMAFVCDQATGALAPVQTLSTLPPGYAGAHAGAEVAVHPNGRFVYASNRGPDNIAIFAIDPQSGQLAYAGEQPTGGKSPRHFAIDPAGRWMLVGNQESDNLAVLAIDQASGKLNNHGLIPGVSAPACVLFA